MRTMLFSFLGRDMRYWILIFAISSQSVMADAYKCRLPDGRFVITEKPCEVGSVTSGSAKSDPVDASSYDRAQSDLNRQKGWVAGREQMHRDDAAIARRQAAAADQAYPVSPPKQIKSESIFDKPWGCGNRSCSQTFTRP